MKYKIPITIMKISDLLIFAVSAVGIRTEEWNFQVLKIIGSESVIVWIYELSTKKMKFKPYQNLNELMQNWNFSMIYTALYWTDFTFQTCYGLDDFLYIINVYTLCVYHCIHITLSALSCVFKENYSHP